MIRSQRIQQLLSKAFAPEALKVIDDSHKHAGHAGARPGGETHYTVQIQAKAFDGLSRVQIHRAIMDVLQPEFQTGLHALAIKASKA